MSSILSEYLILAWVVISVFSVGLAIGHRCFSLRGIDLLGYGAAIGVFVHSIIGVLIASIWAARQVFAIAMIITALFAIFYLLRAKVFSQLFAALNRPLRFALCVWLAFLMVCLAIVHIDVTWPENLPDGRYVFKQHREPVKIQYLTSLPADNYVPYTVTEYFVRHISFKKQHPILPGQEVSNRTILMSLVTVPFRVFLNWNNTASKKLAQFRYVETMWPNTERLNDDDSFEEFLPIGIFLNSLLLLGLLVFFSNLEPAANLVTAALLFATSPYCLTQTIFTWPKALAGFFLLLAWNSLRRGHGAKVVACCAALAYHSHPAAIAALVSLAVWYGWQFLRDRSSWRPLLEYILVLLVAILPWIIWTQFVLKIPTDLITQNFSGAGTNAALSSPINFLWIRAVNAFNTLSPMIFAVFPFRLETVVDYTTLCLPSAVGLFVIPFAIAECLRLSRRETAFIWFGLTIPAAMLLIIFSYPAVPILHGWQAPVGAFIFLGALRMRAQFTKPVFATLITLQIACNLAFLWMRAALVGAHW